MVVGYDNYNGLPCRLYRSPEEIRSDIEFISDKINIVNERFNVREMLLEVLSGELKSDPEEAVLQLEDMVDSAKESLLTLTTLKESLAELESELKEVVGYYEGFAR